MNRTLTKSLAIILGMGIMAGCESQEKTAKPAQRANEIIEVENNKCEDICGGKICYQVIDESKGSDTPKRYAISHEGFGDYSVIGQRLIIADECILYRLGATNEGLLLEKLR